MNQKQAAAAAGISAPQLSKWEGLGNLPKPVGGRYTDDDVTRIKAYAAAARSEANVTKGQYEDEEDDNRDESLSSGIRKLIPSKEKQARIEFLVERTLAVRQKRTLEAGGWRKKEDVEQENVRKVHLVRSKLQELPLQAPLIVGKTEIEIEQVLTAFAKSVCDHFSGGVDV